MQLTAIRFDDPDHTKARRYHYNVRIDGGHVVAVLDRYAEISRPSKRHRNWKIDKLWDSHRAPGHGLYWDPGKPEVPPDVDEEILGILTGTVQVKSN